MNSLLRQQPSASQFVGSLSGNRRRFRLLLCVVFCISSLAISWKSSGLLNAQEPREAENKVSDEEQNLKKGEIEQRGNQARKLQLENKFAEAIEIIQQMLAIETSLYGDVHNEVAGSLSWLADVHALLAQFDKAISLQEHAVAMRKQLNPETHHSIRTAEASLASLRVRQTLTADQLKQLEVTRANHLQTKELQRQGEYQQAIDLQLQARDVIATLVGETDVDYRNAVSFLADTYALAGRYTEAESSHFEVKAIRERLFGIEHPEYAKSLNALAVLYYQMQVAAKAEPLLLEASATLGNTLGKQHPDFVASLSNLAIFYSKMGLPARSEPYLIEVCDIHAQVYGKTHPEYVSSISNLARYYEMMGNLIRAEKLLLEAAGIYEQVLGNDHHDYGVTIGYLANLYRQLGKYAEARPLFLQALSIREQTADRNDPEYAHLLNDLASLYESMDADSQALPLFLEAKSIFAATLGKESGNYAAVVNNLGSLCTRLNDFASAESHLLESLGITEKIFGQEHPYYAASLNNLGLLYVATGDYARAEQSYLRATAIREKVLGKQHPDYAQSLQTLARLYERADDYVRAEPLYVEMVGINQKVLGDTHPQYASSLSDLGSLYGNMADYRRALPLLQKAKAIRESVLGKQHRDYVSSLNSLAIVHGAMGDSQQAIALLHEATALVEKLPERDDGNYATMLTNLADYLAASGDYSSALSLYPKAVAIRERLYGTNHPSYADSLMDFGNIYLGMKEFKAAEACFGLAGSIYEKIGGKGQVKYAASIAGLAFVYDATGNSAGAEPLLLEAVEIVEKVVGKEHPRYAESLSSLATYYAQHGSEEKAVPMFRDVLRASRACLEATSTIQSERQQLMMAENIRYQLDGLLSLKSESPAFADAAYREVLAWKGATLVRQRQMREISDDTNVAPLFRQLQQTATRLATLSRVSPEPGMQVAWKWQMSELTAEKEKLEAELSEKSSVFRQSQKQITLEEVRGALPADAVLIDYLEYTRLDMQNKEQPRVRSLLAFVIDRESPVKLIDLGPVAPVSEAIDTWRRTFGGSSAGVAAGRLLREQIWQPLEEHLTGSGLVLVSVDGVLGRLPLAALPGKKPGSYLLEDHRLAMLPVPQLLPALVNDLGRKELAGGLLLMGDVDYDAESEEQSVAPKRKSWKRSSTALVRSSDQHFSHLDATAGEIATIREVFTELFDPEPDQIKILKRSLATEAEFRHSAARFSNLHLATHGFFAAADKPSALNGVPADSQLRMTSADREQTIRGFNPGLLSGLAFSGANRTPEVDKDDGILTADEISTLSLTGVDLVVLSACETGLGEVAGGEGLLGVQRAFQVAGARSTVASLWQVGDVATRQLMERFYRNYWDQEMSKVDALREAQLYLLNHPETVRGDKRLAAKTDEQSSRLSPQFWAAFSLSGAWE